MTQSDTATGPWLRVAEAAHLLKVHPHTIYKLIRTGDLPAQRLGNKFRIRRDDVLNLEVGKPR